MESRGEGVIVYAVPDFEPAVGGTTTQTGLQARALANRGSDLVVLTLRTDPAWAKRERVGGVEVRRLGLSGRGRLREWTALVAMVVWLSRRRRSIAAVQTVMWTDASAAAALSRLSARTAVLWAIDGEAGAALRGGSPWRRLVTRVRAHVLRRCRHVALTPGDARGAGRGRSSGAGGGHSGTSRHATLPSAERGGTGRGPSGDRHRRRLVHDHVRRPPSGA